MYEPKLIIFSAPSGAGKTTIVQHLLKKMPELSFSISATTRTLRGDEIDGKDYYFMNKEEFLHKVAKHEFVEFEEVYNGTFYGTLRSEIDRIWDEGKHVIFDIDVVGGLRLKRKFGNQALSIFVQAPSIDILVERLASRGTETEEKRKERIAKASNEMAFAKNFDVILENTILETACSDAEKLVKSFIAK